MFSKSLSTNVVLFFVPDLAKPLTTPEKAKILKNCENLSDILNGMFSKLLMVPTPQSSQLSQKRVKISKKCESRTLNPNLNCFSAYDSSKPPYTPLKRMKPYPSMSQDIQKQQHHLRIEYEYLITYLRLDLSC